jgi:hypothetical protein
MNPQYEGGRGTWSVPEYVKVGSIMVVEQGRLPIDEAVVKDIMATIGAGDMSACRRSTFGGSSPAVTRFWSPAAIASKRTNAATAR